MKPPQKPIIFPSLVPDEEAVPRSLNPPGWTRPKGYAHGMAAQGRVVLTGGVVGWDQMGQFPEGFVAQAERCFLNIRARRVKLFVRPLCWRVPANNSSPKQCARMVHIRCCGQQD